MVISNMKTKVFATASIAVLVNVIAISATNASTDADYSFGLTSDWHDCQSLGVMYQEVYAFETDSFYINICQKDNFYFYSGESKQSDRSSIFIPAYPLENNRGFKAVNGNVSYLVLLPFRQEDNYVDMEVSKPAEAILTIKRNDQLVSVESSLNKYCQPAQAEIYKLEDTAIAFDTGKTRSLQEANQTGIISPQSNFGVDIFLPKQNQLVPPEIFESDSRFDFYRVGGKIHRLTTCN